MESGFEKRFHLILVHGIGDVQPHRHMVHKFWSTRFPRSLVTDFPFAPDDSRWGPHGFVERARSLIDTIQTDRHTWGVDTSSDHIPCVFLCHDLGGSLVQQALVLASQGRTYHHITNETAVLIFYNCPSSINNEVERAYEILRLLSRLDPSSQLTWKLLHELPSALEELSSEFSSIQGHHSIIDVTASGYGTDLETDGQLNLPSWGRFGFRLSSSAEAMWTFSPGQTTSEKIFDLICRVLKQELGVVSEEFHHFMQALSRVSPNTHQLRLSKLFPRSLEWITQHPSYREWWSQEDEAPGILYLHGPRGSGCGVVASHIITSLMAIPNSTVISFSFSKQDMRSQSVTTFYISLIRQLLISHPSLFKLVSAITSWIKSEDVFSSDVLSRLFLSLLKGSYLFPIFCVIHGAQDCKAFSFDHILGLLKAHRRLSKGIFKLVVLEEKSQGKDFENSAEICRYIDISEQARRTGSLEAFVRSRIDEIISDAEEWKYVKDAMIKKLCEDQSTFLQASFGMRLLETAKVPSTISAAIANVKNLPPTLNDMYELALDRCQAQFSTPLLPLLIWIAYAVRPLSLYELAVVTTLTIPGELDWEHISFNLPLRVSHDIHVLNGTLVRISGLEVHPIHSSISTMLAEQYYSTEKDPDSMVLSQCLDYLEAALKHISEMGGGNDHDVTLDKLCDAEFQLLPYVAISWPEHYKRARDHLRIKDRLLELLNKNGNAKLLFTLHQIYNQAESPLLPAFDSSLKIASRFGLVDVAADAMSQVMGSKDSAEPLSEALDLAASYGHKEVVEILLERGARSEYAVCFATKSGFLEIVEILVAGNPHLVDNEDQDRRPPFLLAALNGNEQIATYLLRKGANCHVKVGTELTALHIAAMTGQSEFLRSLIQSNLDVNATDKYGSDALMMAAQGGFDDVVTSLLSNETPIPLNRQDSYGMTALHLAILHGHASTSKILLGAGADILTETNDGMSPIHLASREGYLGILRQLISQLIDYVSKGAEEDSMTAKISSNAEEETPRVGADETEANKSMSQEATDVLDNPIEPKTHVLGESNGAVSPLLLATSHGHLDVVLELLKYPLYNSELNRATALLLAAREGFGSIVAELLKSIITTVVHDPRGNSALHLATHHQYPDIVTQLLEYKYDNSQPFDVNAVNDLGWTPLHIAAVSGRLSTVQVLLLRGAQLHRLAKDCQTALHIAAYHGHLYVTEELIRNLQKDIQGEAPESNPFLTVDNEGYTAFARAVEKGHLEIVRSLLRIPSSIITSTQLQASKDALTLAVKSGHEQLVRLLIDKGWDVNAGRGKTLNALHSAASSVSMLEILLDCGADINSEDEDGERPLHAAVGALNPDGIRVLLARGADINATDNEGVTPLWRAAYANWSQSVEELLKWSPDLEVQDDEMKWTALHAAFDSPAITKMLIGSGANPMALDRTGNTPIFLCVDEIHGAEMVRIYLDAEVDLNWTNHKGRTALHGAVGHCGTLETVELLIKNGATINAKDKWGAAPIHIAASSSNANILEFLLDQEEVDPNLDSKAYGTPLMAAVGKSNIQALKILLQKGADINAISGANQGHTAIQVASGLGDPDIIQELLQNKADVNITGGSHGSPLLAAIRNSKAVNVKRLLDAGADINYNGSTRGTALECALSCKLPELVDICLEEKWLVDVNVLSKNERFGTALIAAVAIGDTTNIKKLLNREADPNLGRHSDGCTPAQVAVEKGRLNVLEVLVKHKASLSYKDYLDRRILSHAICWKSAELLPFIWTLPEIDINERDVEQCTPLILAVRRGSSDVVSDLIARQADLNIQDRHGYTALMYAVRCGYGSIVSHLIDSNADLSAKDLYGRDVLYWAARDSSSEIFWQVLGSMKELNPVPSVYQHAVSAAIAANKLHFVEALLEEIHYKPTQADRDGWTALHTAEAYGHSEMSFLIKNAMRNLRRKQKIVKLDLKSPTSWEQNPTIGMMLSPDSRTIKVAPRYMGTPKGIARADHPMVPREDDTYYFEVTIENAGDGSNKFGVGFCEEHVEPNVQLGWREGSWGYHGDDGLVFNTGKRRTLSYGYPFGPKYGQGDTIGCGLNFQKKTAFYTKNGEIIGCAFTDIRGKLFPAISIDLKTHGCTISANFWEDRGDRSNFKFKGLFTDSKTLEETQLAKEAAERGSDSTASSESYDWEFEEDDDVDSILVFNSGGESE